MHLFRAFLRLLMLIIAAVQLFPTLSKAASCVALEPYYEIVPEDKGFTLDSTHKSLRSFYFASFEGAEKALESIEWNEFVKFCVPSHKNGSFSYFLTKENKPSRILNSELEKCHSFIETQVRVVFLPRKNHYIVKSGKMILADGLPTKEDAISVLSVIKNLQMNSTCLVPNSNFRYWKSLYNPPPPTSENSVVEVSAISWSVEGFGSSSHYDVTKSQAQRALIIEITIEVVNTLDSDAEISAELSLSDESFGTEKLTLAPQERKKILFQKKTALSKTGQSIQKKIELNLESKSRDVEAKTQHKSYFNVDVES